MFPVSRLGELTPRMRQRKIARILQAIELEAAGGRRPDPAYLAGLVAHLEHGTPAGVREEAAALSERLAEASDIAALVRRVNALRHAILDALGAEPAEWDLVDFSSGRLDRRGVRTLPMAVFLEDIRSPFNVGSMFRTAEAFGVQRIFLSPRSPAPDHPRARKTSLGAQEVLPWERARLEDLAGRHGIFALELGGIPLPRFAFPADGLVLVGSEELGLSPEALRLADAQAGRVSIPLQGAKRSLNVSVAVGILLHAWRAAITPGELDPPAAPER